MLSSVRRFFSWPRPFLRSSSFFTVKLHFHISSRRFLNFLYFLLQIDFIMNAVHGLMIISQSFGQHGELGAWTFLVRAQLNKIN